MIGQSIPLESEKALQARPTYSKNKFFFNIK